MPIRMKPEEARKMGLEGVKKPKLPKVQQKVAPSVFIAACKAHGLPEPVPEFMFHQKRMWKFDWAWKNLGVALEIEGGIFGRGKACPICKRRPVGAHSSIQRLLSDMTKYREAAISGWKVIRVTPSEVNDGIVWNLLERAIKS